MMPKKINYQYATKCSLLSMFHHKYLKTGSKHINNVLHYESIYIQHNTVLLASRLQTPTSTTQGCVWLIKRPLCKGFQHTLWILNSILLPNMKHQMNNFSHNRCCMVSIFTRTLMSLVTAHLNIKSEHTCTFYCKTLYREFIMRITYC